MDEIAHSTRDGLQVLGICRFSVPAQGGFQVEHASIDDRRAFLYDPARLAYRFAWFENVTLPALAAQRDKAFRLVMMLGEDFPEPWRSRIEAHITAHPQLLAEYVSPLRHRKEVARIMAAHSDPNAEAIAQFRMDDDDAVAIDFTRRLREDFQSLKPYFASQPRMGLDYGRGFVVVDRRDGTLAVRPVLTHFWSAGMAILTRPGDGHHVLGVSHNVTWQSMACVSDVEEFMFLRGEHHINDSQTGLQFARITMDKNAAVDTLQRRFRVDLGALRTALRQASVS